MSDDCDKLNDARREDQKEYGTNASSVYQTCKICEYKRST